MQNITTCVHIPRRFHGMALEDNYQSFVLLCIRSAAIRISLNRAR
jgi:hypothetical protein